MSGRQAGSRWPAQLQVDVLVLGGGNAALCAAIAARQEGASVLIVEKSTPAERGGDSRHTRNLRCAHDAPDDTLTDAYSVQEYWEDLLRVTQGQTNEILSHQLIQASTGIRRWLNEQGIRFQPALGGTLSLSHSNAFYLGGGKALLNRLYQRAESLGIEVWYQARAGDLQFDGATFQRALVFDERQQGPPCAVNAQAVVLASGGFQANIDWLREAWGSAADNFLIRGSANNTGELLAELLQAGAVPVGDARQCHAVAIDARAPKFDGGIVTRLDCIPFGIVVNTQGQRFYDEGEDLWPKRYAIWGRLIAEQPQQEAYVIFDSQAVNDFMPSVFPPVVGESLTELAVQLGLPQGAFEQTSADYNQAVQAGEFQPGVLDNCQTRELEPPKSHWARPIDQPPYYAYPLRPGITFTYLGLTVDEAARVQFADTGCSPNVFAAGEIMAGNILGRGYLAGIGMTIGSVFGRVAGEGAARLVS